MIVIFGLDVGFLWDVKVHEVTTGPSGFGGQVVSTLASGTQYRGRIFRAKKSTACLPSEGKQAVSPMSQICGM
jgi:hypothetical protein